MPSCWRYFAIVRREIFIPSEFKIFSSFESDKDFPLDCSIYFWIFDFITVEEIY